jgi:hypothetical protein
MLAFATTSTSVLLRIREKARTPGVNVEMPKLSPSPGNRSEVLPAVAKRRVRVADGRKSTDALVELVLLVEGVGLAPERFPHVLIAVASSVQSVLCAVIEARDALKAEQERNCEDDLRIELIGSVCASRSESLCQVVIVEKGWE